MTLAELAGLISDVQGERLAQLAVEVPPDQAIVELGSYKGKSTAYLASSGHDVYAVDRWTLGGQHNPDTERRGYADPATFAAFHQQLDRAGVAERVTAIIADTGDVGRGWAGPPVGLLFIDADHDESAVRADLAAWEPHCVGVIAFDDYGSRWPGVVKVVDELIDRRAATREQTETLVIVRLPEAAHAAR